MRIKSSTVEPESDNQRAPLRRLVIAPSIAIPA
jgi:hypothetical protein